MFLTRTWRILLCVLMVSFGVKLGLLLESCNECDIQSTSFGRFYALSRRYGGCLIAPLKLRGESFV